MMEMENEDPNATDGLKTTHVKKINLTSIYLNPSPELKSWIAEQKARHGATFSALVRVALVEKMHRETTPIVAQATA